MSGGAGAFTELAENDYFATCLASARLLCAAPHCIPLTIGYLNKVITSAKACASAPTDRDFLFPLQSPTRCHTARAHP